MSLWKKRSFLTHLSIFFKEIFSSSQSLNSNNYAKHLYDVHELQLPKKTHIAMSKIATSYTNQFTAWKSLTIVFWFLHFSQCSPNQLPLNSHKFQHRTTTMAAFSSLMHLRLTRYFTQASSRLLDSWDRQSANTLSKSLSSLQMFPNTWKALVKPRLDYLIVMPAFQLFVFRLLPIKCCSKNTWVYRNWCSPKLHCWNLRRQRKATHLWSNKCTEKVV